MFEGYLDSLSLSLKDGSCGAVLRRCSLSLAACDPSASGQRWAFQPKQQATIMLAKGRSDDGSSGLCLNVKECKCSRSLCVFFEEAQSSGCRRH